MRGVLLAEFEHVDVEARHLVRPHGADRHVADVALAGDAAVFDVRAGAVLHVLLREIEHVAVGIIGGDAGERPVRRTLHVARERVLRVELVERALDVVDLDPEVIEPGGASALARIDVEPDVAVADVEARLGARDLGRLEAEQRLVEAVEQRIFLADDRDVIELGVHGVPPVARIVPRGDAPRFRRGGG